ncbi:hypothetical protein AAC387_Pa06g0197 [Persea americana]
MDLLATHSNPKYHEHSNTTKIQKEQDREEGKILIRARVRVLCNLLRQASPISVKRWRREFKSLAKGVESDPDFWELVGASTGVLGFGLGLLCVYLTMPASDYSVLKLPRSIEDLRILRDQLESYTGDYTIQVLLGYCMVYIFMQTFMIPGTVFMSFLAGALFGVLKVLLWPSVFSLWPDKLSFLQAQVAKRRECALPYLLPGDSHWSHSSCLCHCQGWNCSWRVEVNRDLYDFQAVVALFFIGIASVTPTLMSKSKT